jgi:hypothetical protein
MISGELSEGMILILASQRTDEDSHMYVYVGVFLSGHVERNSSNSQSRSKAFFTKTKTPQSKAMQTPSGEEKLPRILPSPQRNSRALSE